MSDRDRTTDRRECGGDVAAYALGALDSTEAEAFRHHLQTCSVCQEELTSFRKVVDELPPLPRGARETAAAPAPAHPPRRLRSQGRARGQAGPPGGPPLRGIGA